MSDESRLKCTVHVSGLDPRVTMETLHYAFIPFGDIVDITLPKSELPSSRNPHRGFGYVEFESAEDAMEAIDNMDKSELYGRAITCTKAKAQKIPAEALGSKTAIWAQDGWAEKHLTQSEFPGVAGAQAVADPMEGLEQLDMAGPRPENGGDTDTKPE